MRLTKRTVIASVALAAALGLAGCGQSDEGPAEQAGKKVDQAVQGAADAAAGAASATKEAAGDAVEPTKDAAAGAAE